MTYIGIIGIGFVGNAMLNSFLQKGLSKNKLVTYDKFKDGGIGNFESCLNCEILFLALPTEFDFNLKEYDKNAIFDTLQKLSNSKFKGLIVIKSTVEPGTCEQFSNIFDGLKIVHNPEFLSVKTALEDFNNQKHIVLGKTTNLSLDDINIIEKFYLKYYPSAEISICLSIESESMKSFCNSFYSVKIQFFTELYLLCQKNGSDFNKIKNLMIKNNWINPMHTNIPGPDGKISYGGYCFPKDTCALNEYMKRNESQNNVLNAAIHERDNMRFEDKN